MGVELAEARALVIGLGLSGAAAARALAGAGAEVLVVEADDGEGTRARAAQLEPMGIEVRFTEPDPALLDGRTLVVPSPGVPEHAPLLREAAARSLDVWSEPELAWRLSGGRTRLVAVTGTNGKTTTTELLAACLGVPAAGNIGTPLCDVLTAGEPPALAVAELSSFQLRFASTLAPAVAVLLNVAPDHLDWHGTEEAYADAKAHIWARQEEGDVAVLGVDDPGVQALRARRPPPGRVVGFTLAPPQPGQVGVLDGVITARLPERIPVAPVASLAARGPHQVANACAATAAALSAGAGVEQVAAALRSQRAGPHRLEEVATVAGVRYIDDSKATNPHAAAAALGAFERVVWIAGGLAKGLSFEVLRPLLAERVKAVVTIGTSGPALAALARDLGIPAVEAGELERAVGEAQRLAEPGDTVLLAPACASMDQFRDYVERGEVFARAVTALAIGSAHGS